MAVKTFVPGEVLTASDVNKFLAENLVAIKSVDETVTSSAVLQNDDALVVALLANSVYWVDLLLVIDAGGTPDIQIGFTGPSGTTLALAAHSIQTGGATDGDTKLVVVNALSTGFPFGGLGAGVISGLLASGRVSVGGTPGNLQLQWAQNVSNATATIVKAGSVLRATLIS